MTECIHCIHWEQNYFCPHRGDCDLLLKEMGAHKGCEKWEEEEDTEQRENEIARRMPP